MHSFAQSAPSPDIDAIKHIKTYLVKGKFYINKAGEESADINQSLAYADSALVLSQKMRLDKYVQACSLLFSQIYREARQEDKGKNWSMRALTLAKKHQDTRENIDAHLEAANYFTIETPAQLNEKVRHYALAVDFMRMKHAQDLEMANALKYLGDLHNLQGNYQQALKELQESLAIYQSLHYPQVADLYNLMGLIYGSVDNTKASLVYSQLAVRTIESMKDSSATAVTSYNRLGILYSRLSDPKRAKSSFEKALQLAEKNKDPDALFWITANLSSVYTRLNQPARAVAIIKQASRLLRPDQSLIRAILSARAIDAYLSLKAYSHAQSCYNDLVMFLQEDTIKTDNSSQNFRVAAIRLFIATRQFARIPKLLAGCQEAAEKTGNFVYYAETEQLAYKADSAQKHFESAFLHHQHYKFYNDSLVRRNTDKQAMALELQFETEKKDINIFQQAKNIRMLRQKSQLQLSALQSQKLARNLAFAGASLLILLLGLGYSRYRLKQQANLDMEKKQNAINQQNDSLQQLVTEREWLLKEIHHRVKNNLQIIISLLNSQSIFLTDPDTLTVIQESQNRIFSISLIHQKLYQDENITGIAIDTYIKELTVHLANSFGAANKVRFKILAEKLLLDVAQAVPLGLIMNEAITNSMKYAFPGDQLGQITIVLRQEADDWLVLELQDNGVGIPADYDLYNSTTLGMSLITGLSEQLNADLDLITSPGVTIKLRWRKSNPLKSLPRS